MRIRSIFLLAASAGALAACHQPMVTPKLPTFQASEITVRDWQNAARDVASELRSLPPDVTSRPVFVGVSDASSIFLREAADTLEGEILRRGGSIARSPNDATVVSLKADLVRWTPGDLFPSNTEAVLRVTVESNKQLVMKLVEPVYVRDGDVALYRPTPPLATRLLRYETDK